MLFETYQADTLKGKQLEPPSMVVEGLLPVGLTEFAGNPKLGKSWLVLLLCCCITQQKPFLGRQTMQGSALYLDLEGSPYRIQERLTQLGMGFPEYLTIAHNAPRLGNGLIEAIDEWFCTCSAVPKIVVIDTVARIRGNVKHNQNEYNSDSEMYAPLQRYAVEKEIAIVAVTHLKKTNNIVGTEIDWVEKITGSMGLAAVSDNIWGLFRKRGESTAALRTSSRDIDAGNMILGFDNGMWTFVSDDIDSYAFLNNPFVKFLSQVDFFAGSADELLEKYLAFCKDKGIQHNLSDSQPKVSFGKQLKPLLVQGWRINRNIIRTRHTDGVYYLITKNNDEDK